MPSIAPALDPREGEIRQALADHASLTDRAIAKLLRINRWSRITRVRERVEANHTTPEPVDLARRTCPHPGCGYVAKTPGGLAVHDARRHRILDTETPASAPSVQILAPDVPVPDDEPPPRPVITPNPTITCTNCGREGTPHPDQPQYCKACASGPDAAAWRATQLWQCSCGGPFARSTRDLSRCIRCTGEYDRAARRHRTGAFFAAD